MARHLDKHPLRQGKVLTRCGSPLMRTVYDQMGKALTSVLLGLAGQSEAALEIASQIQEADIVFHPNPDLLATNQERLGLLGRIAAAGPCLIELFSKTPGVDELRSCLRKQHNLHHALCAEAERAAQPKPDFPNLWVLSAGMPETAIDFFALMPMPDWPAGLWQGKHSERMHVVALRLLPMTPDTLFLRLLGRGMTFIRAFQELIALPHEHWARRAIESMVLAFWPKLSQHYLQDDVVNDPTEDPMSALQQLRELGERVRRQYQDEGRLEGRGEEARRILQMLLSERFGELPAPTLARLDSAELDQLEAWLRRVITASTLDDVFAGQATC